MHTQVYIARDCFHNTKAIYSSPVCSPPAFSIWITLGCIYVSTTVLCISLSSNSPYQRQTPTANLMAFQNPPAEQIHKLKWRYRPSQTLINWWPTVATPAGNLGHGQRKRPLSHVGAHIVQCLCSPHHVGTQLNVPAHHRTNAIRTFLFSCSSSGCVADDHFTTEVNGLSRFSASAVYHFHYVVFNGPSASMRLLGFGGQSRRLFLEGS